MPSQDAVFSVTGWPLSTVQPVASSMLSAFVQLSGPTAWGAAIVAVAVGGTAVAVGVTGVGVGVTGVGVGGGSTITVTVRVMLSRGGERATEDGFGVVIVQQQSGSPHIVAPDFDLLSLRIKWTINGDWYIFHLCPGCCGCGAFVLGSTCPPTVVVSTSRCA